MDQLKGALNNFSGGNNNNNENQQGGSNDQKSSSGGGGFLSGLGDKMNSAAGGGKEGEKNEDYLDKGTRVPKFPPKSSFLAESAR